MFHINLICSALLLSGSSQVNYWHVPAPKLDDPAQPQFLTSLATTQKSYSTSGHSSRRGGLIRSSLSGHSQSQCKDRASPIHPTDSVCSAYWNDSPAVEVHFRANRRQSLHEQGIARRYLRRH